MEKISFQATIVGNNQITVPIETREFLQVGVGDILDIDISRVRRKTGSPIDVNGTPIDVYVDMIALMMAGYEGSAKHHNTFAGFSLIASKLEDVGVAPEIVDMAIDKHTRQNKLMDWMKRTEEQ